MKIASKLAYFAVGLPLFLYCICVSAQTSPKAPDQSIKFDEYGDISADDHSARLDNLAIHLLDDPALKGQIIYYGPERTGKLTYRAIQDYLVNNRGVDPDRLESIYGGPNDDLKAPRIELWLSPPGASPPVLGNYKNDSDTFTGLFDDSPAWDTIALGECGCGPPIPGVILESFAEMVTKRKNAVPYLVAFNGSDAALGAWRRVTQLEVESLKNFGVETDRLKILFGGADKETKIQLWILPEDAPPPMTVISVEALPKTTVQIGSFSDYDIAEERGERWAFNGFVDVLRSNDNLRACIIVRLANALEEQSEEESVQASRTIEITQPMETVEFPKADFLKLVEKWRTELADKYKIQPDRFIVLFTSVPKDSGNSLETWIVPAGAALPDPEAGSHEEQSEPEDEGNSDKKSDSVIPEGKPPR